jgi:large subunit ribosomal protein L24
MKLNIKKDDLVVIIAGEGRDRTKTKRVLKVDREKGRVVVEGVNIKSRATKPNAANPNGGIVKREGSIHISNVQLVSDGKPTRVGTREEKGKTVRYSKKTDKTI